MPKGAKRFSDYIMERFRSHGADDIMGMMRGLA